MYTSYFSCKIILKAINTLVTAERIRINLNIVSIVAPGSTENINMLYKINDKLATIAKLENIVKSLYCLKNIIKIM